jgi:hypothetical protein
VPDSIPVDVHQFKGCDFQSLQLEYSEALAVHAQDANTTNHVMHKQKKNCIPRLGFSSSRSTVGQ